MMVPERHSTSVTRRLPGNIPIPLLALGLPLAGVLFVIVATHLYAPAAQSPASTPLRSADLVMQDQADGSIIVRQADDNHVIDVLHPATNAFLRVVLAGLVRERRREGEGAPSQPFHLTRWSDGRLTIDDIATHKLIELNAFGPSNYAVFAHLLSVSRPAQTN